VDCFIAGGAFHWDCEFSWTVFGKALTASSDSNFFQKVSWIVRLVEQGLTQNAYSVLWFSLELSAQ